MTLILLFTIIYITNISDALVCYQCSNPSTISNPLLKYFIDALLKKQVEENRLDSANIFCNNIDDLGEEKTCDSGSYCYTEELQLQSNLALRNFLVTTKKFLKFKSSLFQTFS